MVVAQNLTDTTYVDKVAEPEAKTSFYYTVITECDGISSSPAESNTVDLGNYVPPYEVKTTSSASINEFTVIDANNDGKKWKYSYTGSNSSVNCAYSSTKDMDDWLISPKIKFHGGKTYKFAVEVRGSSTTKVERFELKLGKEATAEAQTLTVIDTTEVKTNKATTYEAHFTVPETGLYNLGFHGISEKKNGTLYIRKISVSAPVVVVLPAAVSDLKAEADPSGALKAVISATAPTHSASGDTLTSLTKIEIARNDTLVQTLTDVAPGKAFSWEDSDVKKKGNNTWKVTCYNENGAGTAASVTTFIGFDRPAPVDSVKVVENPQGTLVVTWEPSLADINGKPFNGYPVTYTVAEAANLSIVYAQGLTSPTYTHVAAEPGHQTFFRAAVFAETADGISTGTTSAVTAAGTPYPMPYCESFPDGVNSYNIATRTTVGSGVKWSLCKDGNLGINSADEDNGFFAGRFTNLKSQAMVYSGKIDLTNAQNPEFSFYTYNIFSMQNGQPAYNINEVEMLVRELGKEDWDVIKKGTVNELCEGDTLVWKKISQSLVPYKGKQIQIGLRNRCLSYNWVMFDKIEVREKLQHDLMVTEITAPENAKPNQEVAVNVIVKNYGAAKATDYSVEFYRDNAPTPFRTVQGIELAPETEATFNAGVKLSILESDAQAKYHAVVKYDLDENTANNTSDQVTIVRKFNNRATPTELRGGVIGREVTLNWNVPSVDNTTSDLESCEEFESWAHEDVGDWTFIDVDGAPIGGFQNMEVPQNPQGSRRAFFVFDHKNGPFANTSDMVAHSGDKYLASLFRLDDGQVDDWAVSPMLDGSQQTVTFWARSYSARYAEKMQILYTNGSATATDDYEVLQTVDTVPNTWTLYSVNVPAGAKHFAIRSYAKGAFMFMLDDITFRGLPKKVDGYNVYRDGKILNTALVAENKYVDPKLPKGEHTFHVTAVYNDGLESAPSNSYVGYTSVNQLTDGISVNAGHGFIAIIGAEGKEVSIINMTGINCYNAVPESSVRVPLAAGVYLVRIADENIKVIVR